MIYGALLSILSASCFAIMAVLGKLAYSSGMTEWDQLTCRFIFGAFALFIWLRIKRKSLVITPKTLLGCALIGLFVYTAQSLCFIRSLKYISASTTALIFYGHPALITLLSVTLLKMKATRAVLWSLLLVTFGCALVFIDAFTQSASTVGLLYATGALVIFSGYMLLCQLLLTGEQPLVVAFYVILFTAIGYSCIHPPTELLKLNYNQLLIGVLYGIIPTAMAVSLLYLAVERIGSALATIFSSCEPVVTLVIANLVLGDPIRAYQLIGTLLILGGIILPNASNIIELSRSSQLKPR